MLGYRTIHFYTLPIDSIGAREPPRGQAPRHSACSPVEDGETKSAYRSAPTNTSTEPARSRLVPRPRNPLASRSSPTTIRPIESDAVRSSSPGVEAIVGVEGVSGKGVTLEYEDVCRVRNRNTRGSNCTLFRRGRATRTRRTRERPLLTGQIRLQPRIASRRTSKRQRQRTLESTG